ncbi:MULTISPECIES: hypothetical protein [unclassified Saccharothrix]|uniref:hypothetical protein n=1 Tax=unclassified Saccharothrix TaxID=2593673 RepID=UPI00307F9738
MRALLTALVALVLLAPSAVADESVAIASRSHRGLVLSVDDQSEPVTLQPREVAGAQWRVNVSNGGFLTVVNWDLRGCLTAFAVDDVRVLECIGTPSQSWVDQPRAGGWHALGNAAHAGLCLTAIRPFDPVEMTPCASGDRDQEWRW